MYEIIINRRGLAAGLALGDLLDDSYLAVPGQSAPATEPPQGQAAGRAASDGTEAASRVQLWPALRHLLG